jgi:hypothetical protein
VLEQSRPAADAAREGREFTTRIDRFLNSATRAGSAQVACYPLSMHQRPGIYVEILIHGDIKEVWKHTQRPELHQLWDLRFTKIQYLPRASEAEPQRSCLSENILTHADIDLLGPVVDLSAIAAESTCAISG